MFLSVYIILEMIAMTCLILAFIPFQSSSGFGKRQYMTSLLSTMLFLYLAISSAYIQTENCANKINQSIENGSTTIYNYDYECVVNDYVDKNQMYFNSGLAFVSIAYSIILMLVKKGEI